MNKFNIRLIFLIVFLFNTFSFATMNDPNEVDKMCKSWRAMGRIFLGLEEIDKSKEYFEKAYNYAKTNSASSFEFSCCLIDLAYLYKDFGKLKDAEVFCMEGLKIQEDYYGKDHPYIANILRTIADIHRQLGEYDKAKTDINNALTIFSLYHNANESSFGPIFMDMGSILADSDMLSEAEKYYSDAENMIINTYGKDHPYTGVLYSRISELYLKKKDLNNAKLYLEKSIKINNKYEISNPLKIATVCLLQAKINLLQGDYKNALLCTNKAIAVSEKNIGKNSVFFGECLSTISTINIAKGNMPEAEKKALQAVSILENLLGEENPRVLASKSFYNEILHKQKHFSETIVFNQNIQTQPESQPAIQRSIAQQLHEELSPQGSI